MLYQFRYLIVLLLLNFCHVVFGIDCFKCISWNHSKVGCEDKFHNNYSVEYYEAPCMASRKGRNGLFPATHCVKMTGKYEDSEETITIRTCALDSGTLTTDTEIVRMSHCGGFYFDGRYAKGCVQSCNDADGCNTSNFLKPSLVMMLVSQSALVFITKFINTMIYGFTSVEFSNSI